MTTRNLVIGLLIIAGISFLLINPTPTVTNQRTNPAASFNSKLKNMTADEVLADTPITELTTTTKETAYDTNSRAVKDGDTINVHYRGWLAKDGSVFDQSFNRNSTYTFTVGGNVIKGWSQGVVGMQIGEVRRLKIPSTLGYGEAGNGASIPANADLIFDVELVSFN